jgi:hypothetical protein
MVEGGGDASQIDIAGDDVDYMTPYFGPCHAEEGGGEVLKLKSRRQSANQWLIRDQLVIPKVELPTEIRKKELKQESEDSEHFLTLDERFISLVWGTKYKTPGLQRDHVIGRFWKQVYGDCEGDEEGLRLRSFVLNDFLHALEGLRRLELPTKRVDTASWGFPWTHRSSADTDGPSSQGSSRVGTGSIAGLGSNGYVCGMRSPSPNLGRNLFPSVEVFSD